MTPLQVLHLTPKQKGIAKICNAYGQKECQKPEGSKTALKQLSLHTWHGNQYVFCPYLLIVREIKQVFPALEQVFSLLMQMS